MNRSNHGDLPDQQTKAGKSHARTGQPLRCGPITVQALADNSVMPDLPRSGVHELHPDWASLRTLGPGSSAVYAAVMCSIVERIPQNRNRPDSSICPRMALKKILDLALHQWGVQFLVGFKVELVILGDKKTRRTATLPSCPFVLVRDLRRHYALCPVLFADWQTRGGRMGGLGDGEPGCGHAQGRVGSLGDCAT